MKCYLHCDTFNKLLIICILWCLLHSSVCLYLRYQITCVCKSTWPVNLIVAVIKKRNKTITKMKERNKENCVFIFKEPPNL